jgi:hypothetical protein
VGLDGVTPRQQYSVVVPLARLVQTVLHLPEHRHGLTAARPVYRRGRLALSRREPPWVRIEVPYAGVGIPRVARRSLASEHQERFACRKGSPLASCTLIR